MDDEKFAYKLSRMFLAGCLGFLIVSIGSILYSAVKPAYIRGLYFSTNDSRKHIELKIDIAHGRDLTIKKSDDFFKLVKDWENVMKSDSLLLTAAKIKN